jgi:acyl carrier protein
LKTGKNLEMTIGNERNWEAIRDFVAVECGVPAETLTSETTLFGDLGIDGDDAIEFFEAFQERFGVDLASLDMRRYFGPEGWPLRDLVIMPFWLLWMARPGDPHQKARVQPIHLFELMSAAESGRWPCVETSDTKPRLSGRGER